MIISRSNSYQNNISEFEHISFAEKGIKENKRRSSYKIYFQLFIFHRLWRMIWQRSSCKVSLFLDEASTRLLTEKKLAVGLTVAFLKKSIQPFTIMLSKLLQQPQPQMKHFPSQCEYFRMPTSSLQQKAMYHKALAWTALQHGGKQLGKWKLRKRKMLHCTLNHSKPL